VARLYSEPGFAALAQQFEGELRLEFLMAPLRARPAPGQPPAQAAPGGRMLPLMRVLARGKVLRVARPRHSAERRMERPGAGLRGPGA
jgi:indolepyruvate ferredoxin oxidoreductase